MEGRKESVLFEAVFFDFDGVILDSVNVKTEAFATLFRSYGAEIEKQVVEYHLSHGGISRFDKFRYYYEELLHTPVNEEQIVQLGKQFSELALQGVLNSPFIEGALESLKELHQQRIPAFVASGTPEEELRYIIRKRDIDIWFTEAHGSPRLKYEIILDIQARYNLRPSACLFIGDAMTDYNAAISTGTRFLGIVPSNTSSTFPPGTSFCSKVSFL